MIILPFAKTTKTRPRTCILPDLPLTNPPYGAKDELDPETNAEGWTEA